MTNLQIGRFKEFRKKLGRPWDIGKAFEASAPVGPIRTFAEAGHADKGKITLRFNSELRQDGKLDRVIWKVSEQIACLSEYYELAPGDLILSGTPSGVATVIKGDVMEVEDLGKLTVNVV